MRAATLLLPLGALLATACVSTVSVDRVDPGETADGLVYSLPKTFMVVKPKPDGTMSVTFEFLADPERTYAIKAKSIAAKHTLDVKLSPKGLLKEVEWKPASVAVGEAALSVVAKLYEEKLKDRDEAKAAAKKREEDAKKKVTDLEAAVKAGRRALELHESELRALGIQLSRAQTQQPPNPALIDSLTLSIFKKQEEIRFARSDLAAAEAALAEALGELRTASIAAEFTSASVDKWVVSAAKQATAWGGVVFEIVEGYAPEDYQAYLEKRPIFAAPFLRAVPTVGDPSGNQAQLGFETGGPPRIKPTIPNVPPAEKLTLAAEGSTELLLPESREFVISATNKSVRAEALATFLEEQKAGAAAILTAKQHALEARIAKEQALAAEQRNGLVLVIAASSPITFGEIRLYGSPHSAQLATIAGSQFSPTKARVTLPRGTTAGAYYLECTYAVPTSIIITLAEKKSAKIYFSVR